MIRSPLQWTIAGLVGWPMRRRRGAAVLTANPEARQPIPKDAIAALLTCLRA